jgi:spore maturation protein SpmA
MKESKPAPLNIIWLLLIVAATLVAALSGTMAELTKASFDAAKDAVTLAIGLVGAMALWLGIVRVAEDAGLMRLVARAIRPVMVRLFPDVPPEHPAMSAMIMNMAANMLGLGNAATPMGIKAMSELDKLNPQKGTATNAMCLFLAINTSSVTLLPLGVIAVRASAKADMPGAILIPSLIATLCSTAVAIVVAKLLARREKLNTAATQTEAPPPDSESAESPRRAPGHWARLIMWAVAGLFPGVVVYRFLQGQHPPLFSIAFVTTASAWLIPLLMCGLLLFGWFRGVHVYESLIEGAKEGFTTAVRIIPFMVAIFVAIGMFRASGAMDLIAHLLGPILKWVGMPAEALPVALLRPLSGSGSFALTSEIIHNAPNSFASFLASVMQGSTETTFYVLAVYFGSVSVFRTRHALPAALLADLTGIVASVVVCHAFFVPVQ